MEDRAREAAAREFAQLATGRCSLLHWLFAEHPRDAPQLLKSYVGPYLVALAGGLIGPLLVAFALACIIHDGCPRPKREALSGLGLVSEQVVGCAAA